MTPLLKRPRRLRMNATLREMIAETTVESRRLIFPLFVKEGIAERVPVSSMPGIFQFPLKEAVSEAKTCWKKGIRGVILFGIPSKKDDRASGAYAKNGVVQQAVKAIKEACPGLLVVTDVCLCEYMSHGHCGVVRGAEHGVRGATHHAPRSTLHAEVDNDSSVELIAQTALSHAEAGADLIAPSDMMDGRIRAIRAVLDKSGFPNLPIMSYAVKYASSFYGPFREAAESAPQFGDRKTYQMDFSNAREALREARLDEEEGADIILIKPALPYLDILSKVVQSTTLPVAAYQVSGEYSQIVAAAEKGWIDRKKIVVESLTAIRRSGAQLIVTYFAKEVSEYLRV